MNKLFISFIVFCKKNFLKDRRFHLCSENDLNLKSIPYKVKVFFWTKCFNSYILKQFSELVVPRCSVKKVFLRILQNSRENTCARNYLLLTVRTCSLNISLQKKWPAKFLRFFTESPGFLKLVSGIFLKLFIHLV